MHLFFSSRRRHTRLQGDWSSDVCSYDLRSRFRRSSVSAACGSPVWSAAKSGSFWAKGSTAGDMAHCRIDWKSGVLGKSVDIGGGRIIKKKKWRTPMCDIHV